MAYERRGTRLALTHTQWLSVFSETNAVVFITALSDYSSGIIEDLSSNGMVESLVLFESIVNSQWFVKTAIVSGSPTRRLHPFCC